MRSTVPKLDMSNWPVHFEPLAMLDVSGAIFGLLSRRSVTTDGAFFRLNYRITVIILVASAFVILAQEIIQGPMKCSFANFTEGDFDRFCSLQSVLSLKRKVTAVEEFVSDGCSAAQSGIHLRTFTYYQLGFITLLLQAVLFYSPRYLWNSIEGGRMKMLATELITSTKDKDCNENNSQPLISYFRKHFHGHDNYAYYYILCELLTVFNLVVQLQLLHSVIDSRFGISDIYDVLTGQQKGIEHVTGRLLSMTTECTHAGPFHLPGNPDEITGICPLLENSANDQLQVFLSFWMYLLTIYGIFVILYRFATCLSSSLRFIKFRSSCGVIIPRETIAVAYDRLKFGDWFILLMLRKNIDVLEYEELIFDIADNYESHV